MVAMAERNMVSLASRRRKASTAADSPIDHKRCAIQHPPSYAHESPGLLNTFNPSRYPELHDRLCSLLNIQDALSLSSACKNLREAHKQRFDVDKRLERFVRNPQRLRSQLGKHGSLISGSFALQLFAQTRWKDSDLDIFVDERGEAVTEFHTYLQQEENYCLESAQDQEMYAMERLAQV